MARKVLKEVDRFYTLGEKIIIDGDGEYDISYPDNESVVRVLNAQEEIIRKQRKELQELKHKDKVIGDFVRDIFKQL